MNERCHPIVLVGNLYAEGRTGPISDIPLERDQWELHWLGRVRTR